MKLTQKTIFQCFDRSGKNSTIIIEDDEDIIECHSDPKSQPKSEEQPDDFLIPVHVRQEEEEANSSNSKLSSSSCWNEVQFNDLTLIEQPKTFSGISSINNEEHCYISELQFKKILSIERQTELFQKYITEYLSSYAQSVVDWKEMFKYLQEYREKAIEQNQHDQLPWTEIYRPHHSKSYLGYHREPVRRLNEWFSFWSKKLHNEKPKKDQRSGRKRRRGQDDDDSDSDFLDQSNKIYHQRCQVQSEHPQIVFIHGSGTTSLVHALAEEHHFKVTEFNSSQSRSRTLLLKQLEQMTSHHYLSIKRCSSDSVIHRAESIPAKKRVKNERGTLHSFFPDKKEIQTKSTKLNKKKKNDEQLVSTVQVEKSSLILFDEIETLTDDEQFWSCLKKLLETAKKPILLTSNNRTNPEETLANLSKIGSHQFIDLEENEPEFICCFLRLILLVEMLEVSSINQFEAFCQSCSFDLRQCLLTLQFLSQSSSSSSSSHCSHSSPSTTQSAFFSSQFYDSLYFTHLTEQWNSSILQTQFEDLTRGFENKYHQSSRLTTKTIENTSKRKKFFQTLKNFLDEQQIDQIGNGSAIFLDYRPFIRQICQHEQIRATESNSTRRLRHCLNFRGCSLQWSDYSVLSDGLD